MSEEYDRIYRKNPDAWDLDKLYAAICAYADRQCRVDLDTVMTSSFAMMEYLVGVSATIALSREDFDTMLDLAWDAFANNRSSAAILSEYRSNSVASVHASPQTAPKPAPPTTSSPNSSSMSKEIDPQNIKPLEVSRHPDAWDHLKLYKALCAYGEIEETEELDSVVSSSFAALYYAVFLNQSHGITREQFAEVVDGTWMQVDVEQETIH